MAQHTVYKNLPCELTREEIATYSQELAEITSRTAEIEGEKKEVMSDFAAKLNKCLADARVLARKITTRKEDRSIECDLDFDYSNGKVYTVRTDTGVTIDQRKMTDDERQEWLDFERKDTEQQEKEDAATELTEKPANELKPVMEEPSEGVTVCGNTVCKHNSSDSLNGCGQFEHAWECSDSIGEVVSLSDDEETEEKAEEKNCSLDPNEIARRCEICADWITCEHKDICFTPQNEEAGICFKDEPHRLPVEPELSLAAQKLAEKIIIKLPVKFFTEFDDGKGELKKAYPTQAGVPESGKISKVFVWEENLYILTGASHHHGLQSVSAYRLMPRKNWDENEFPVVTVAARNSEPRKSHLVHSRCLIEYKNEEFVVYRPVEFVRAPIDPAKCGNKKCPSYSLSHSDNCAVSVVGGVKKPVADCNSFKAEELQS